MFPYLRPMDRFLDDCNGSETCDDWNCLNCDNKTRLTDWLTERVGKANWGAEVESREIRSWCQSVCFYMKEVLSGLDNNKIAANNIAVGLEYYTEVEKSGRVDMMLGGYNAKGEKTIIVIELKQWTNGFIEKEQKKGEKYDDPRKQVASYCDRLKKQLEEDYREEIKLIPVVYLHNEDEGITLRNETGITEIKKGEVEKGSWNVHVFLADDDSKAEFRQLIEDSLKGTSADKQGLDVFRFLRKYSVVFDINDLAKIVASDKTKRMEYIKRLHPDQYNAYTKIEAHIKSGKKHIDIVHGGPGSGKTLIALLLVNYCMQHGKRYAFVYEGAAAPNALEKAWNSLYANQGSDEENQFNNFIYMDGFKKTNGEYDVVIFDEFHRYSGNMEELEAIINRAGTTVLLVDEDQRITEKNLRGDRTDENENTPEITIREFLNNDIDEFNGIDRKDFHLWSLFRCNQDEGYVTWVEQLLSGQEPDVYLDELTFMPVLIKDKESLKKLYDRVLGSFKDGNESGSTDFKTWTLTAENWETPEKYKKRGKDDKEGEFYRDIVEFLNGIYNNENLFFDKADSKMGELEGITKADENKYKIDIGTHFRVQGVERDNVIVIIGNEITAKNKDGKYVLYIRGKQAKDVTDNSDEQWVQNRYRVLLTRGLKKCYIYCMDKGMRDYLQYLEKKEYTPAN